MDQWQVRNLEQAFQSAFEEYMEGAREYGTEQLLDTCIKRLEELDYSQDALDDLRERDLGLQDEWSFDDARLLREAQEALHNIWLMEYGTREDVTSESKEPWSAQDVLGEYRDELRDFNAGCTCAQGQYEHIEINLPD